MEFDNKLAEAQLGCGYSHKIMILELIYPQKAKRGPNCFTIWHIIFLQSSQFDQSKVVEI